MTYIMEGSVSPVAITGAPVDGTDEVQTLTHDATQGTYTLTFDGYTTAAIAFDADDSAIQTALEALPNVGSGGIVVTGGSSSPWTLTFAGNLGKKAQSLISATASGFDTGETVTVTEATAGVDATLRGAGIGALAIDTTNGALYQNTGTALDPAWHLISAATGYTTEVLDVVVDCSTPAASQDVGDVPAGSVIVSAAANLDTAITVSGSTPTPTAVGLGTAADPDAYGKTTAVTQNAKITNLIDWAVLAAQADIILSPVDSNGDVPTSSPEIGGAGEQITVRIVYYVPAALPNA